LRYVIYSCSLLYALNALRFNIRDSKLYISFSISLLALLWLRHYVIKVRRWCAGLALPTCLGYRLAYETRYILYVSNYQICHTTSLQCITLTKARSTYCCRTRANSRNEGYSRTSSIRGLQYPARFVVGIVCTPMW
jgi:hypothetical protein